MTLGQLELRVFQRLDQAGARPGYYTGTEIRAALDAAQHVFVLLTLCLERTAPLALTANQVFYQMLTVAGFSDWLLPLRARVTGAGGKKLDYSRLSDFDALKLDWQQTNGTPERYAHLGFELLAIDRQPAAGGVSLDLTFAYCPLKLTSPAQAPEIPAEHHPSLIDYAIPALRAKEGGAEFASSLQFFERFLEEAKKLADFVRARNQAAGYDRFPFELGSYDRSKLIVAMKNGGQGRSSSG